MKKKPPFICFSISVLLAGVVLGVVAGIAILGFASPVFEFKEGPAWIQALGTILIFSITILFFFAEIKQREEEERKRNTAHILSLMGTIEEISLALITTIEDGGCYQKHLEVDNNLAIARRANSHKEVLEQFIRFSRPEINLSFNDYCQERAQMLQNAYDVLKSIDWTKYPISLIGIEIVAITNEFFFFYEILKNKSKNGEEKEKELKQKARNVNRFIHNANEKLNETFGYESSWPYEKELLWEKPKRKWRRK